MAKIIRLPSAFVIESKVVGVSKPNADGSSRQEIIRQYVSEGEKLVIEPEPENPHDSNAIKVLVASGQMIGYLPKDIAARLQGPLGSDVDIHVTATWVSGDELMGVGLRIELVN